MGADADARRARPGVSGAGVSESGSNAELEVIDPRLESSTQADAIDRVCRDLGFFRIPFDVIDVQTRERAWDDAAAFFALPEAEKLGAAFPEPGYPYGYAPFEYERLAASDGDLGESVERPDLKETLSVGPDCLGAIPSWTDPSEGWLRSPSMWPAAPASLRQSFSAYFAALSVVSARLLSIMAIALDMPGDHFDSLIDQHTAALRALRYPPLTSEPDPNALRAGAHSDYGTLTILRTDGVPGLEVRDASGQWRPVVDEPGTFVVNLGDSIQRWTNDRWRSTVHRVTPVDSGERHSMAFFHMANWNASIECLPTCQSPSNAARYEPVMAGPWLMEKFKRTVG